MSTKYFDILVLNLFTKVNLKKFFCYVDDMLTVAFFSRNSSMNNLVQISRRNKILQLAENSRTIAQATNQSTALV